MTSEQYIAIHSAEGDIQAQRQLYETYAGWLLGICLRYVGDRDTAQDLMHDGIEQILSNITKFKWQGEGSLKAWIYRVMLNVVFAYLRKQKLSEDTISIDDNPDVVMHEPEPEAVRDIPQKELMNLISQLPTGYRAVFNLYVIEGRSHKEIGEILGINEKTSSSQLSHARRLLARKINDWRKENL